MARSKKFTAEELQIIADIQSERGTTRKSAIRYFQKNRDHYMRRNTKAAVAPAVDVKMAAANDKSYDHSGAEQGVPANPANAAIITEKPVATKTRKAIPTVQTMTPEERGKARAEGLRLYSLAGKPKKSDFIRVFGKKGPAWTWEARAKAVGLASAEECAEKFSKLLKKAAR